MAIFKLGAMFDAISGKVGGQSLANYPQQQILRNITQTNKFATPKQSKKRAFTAYLANSWRQLTTAQQQGWSATAVNYTYVNRVGDTITRNGYQTFSFCNQNLNLIEIPTIQNAPLYVPVTVPKVNIIDISSGNFEIQSNNSSSDYLYALFGVANLSPGQAPQLGMMRYIGEITSAQLAAGYDVVSDLEDVFGTLTFPNKMAITVDPINQTTGNRKQFVDIIQNIDLPMILEVIVPSATSVTVPFKSGGTFNGSIDWGDGTTTTFLTYNAAGCTHTYTLAGTYRILIYGAFPKFVVFNGAFKAFLRNIHQFGTNNFTELELYGCTLLTTLTPSDTPRVSGIAIEFMFRSCTGLLSVNKITEWDLSTCTSLRGLFQSATLYNQDLSLLDVSNISNFYGVFTSASSFNSSLSAWSVTKGTTFFGMFQNASAFNQPLNLWVINTTTNVDMTFMFYNATNYAQDLSMWDFSKNTSLFYFFRGNKMIWDVSLMSVANVSSFYGAFYGRTGFNPNLAGWAIKQSGTIDMGYMFQLNTGFNRSLATWDIRFVTLMPLFGAGCTGWTVANWNLTLIGWNALINPPLNIVISVKPISTGAGAAARANLIAVWGWTINENV